MQKRSSLESRKSQAIDEFKYILDTYIFPLLQCEGSAILKIESTSSKNLKKHIKCYKKGISSFLYFFPALATPQFHFRMRTNNPSQDLGAAEQILREILRVSRFDYRTEQFSAKRMYDKKNMYRNAMFNVAFEVGLCNWLGSECIYELIRQLRDWSQKTYEGNHVSFGFIIDASKKTTGTIDYLSFLKSNHSAVFTDGMSSGIKLDNSGRIVKYFSAIHERTLEDKKYMPWTPYDFIDFTNMCCSENGSEWIGIIMQSNGDMLVFKSRQLVFVKRNGKWMYLDSYTIHETIKARYKLNTREEETLYAKEFADEVYLSVLDTSFAHTGGCIAIIDDQYVDIVQRNCFPKDSLDNNENPSEKKTVIKRLISTGSSNSEKHYFQYLDRKLRIELLSLDGATVLDSSGKILCVGAIVRIEGGSEGGGRTAAAKELAKYGLAMKISMDGCIQCFASENAEKDSIEIFKTL
ncbi:MAG: hypothetical protein IJU56_04130 [Clostridia bacterium]|nr:hypothetical protein [Clostridia bacterium]